MRPTVSLRPSRRALRLIASVAVVLAAAACRDGGRQTTSAEREEAYRANNLGVAALEQFKYDEAATAFRRALAVEPSLGIARVNLGLALFLSGDLAGADREPAASQRLLPSAPQPPYLLGLV